jgi:uncharacterized protein
MTIRVKVTPRSSSSGLAGVMADGTLKIRVVAAPEKGKANAELCQVLARHYGVAPNAVTVVSGHTSAVKLMRLEGVHSGERTTGDALRGMHYNVGHEERSL